MGYAHYEVYRDGLRVEAGYGVADVCNLAACAVAIDRGLGYLCGRDPGGDEFGCGHYFCAEHLLCVEVGDESVQVCEPCSILLEARRVEEEGPRVEEEAANGPR